jgi:hypothetical protein
MDEHTQDRDTMTWPNSIQRTRFLQPTATRSLAPNATRPFRPPICLRRHCHAAVAGTIRSGPPARLPTGADRRVSCHCLRIGGGGVALLDRWLLLPVVVHMGADATIYGILVHSQAI